MRDFTIENLTDTVLEEYQTHTKDERSKVIFASLIRHLHAFVKDVELAEEEWFTAIDFLTRTGQMCDDKRQEYVLLSDVLGVSMLVDAINHPRGGKGTDTTVLGPFYVQGSPVLPKGASLIKKDIGAPQVLVKGTVTDHQGAPIAGAMMDVWQTSDNGFYDIQDEGQPEYNMRGKLMTDEKGEYAFITERPQPYSIPTDGPVGELLRASGRHAMRPAHIHFILTAEGYRSVTTHIFTEGDKYLDSDAVFATKSSLIADFQTCEDNELAKEYGLSAPFCVANFDFGLMTQ